MGRNNEYHYITIPVKRDSWLYECIIKEVVASNAINNIAAMLRSRLEKSYAGTLPLEEIAGVIGEQLNTVGERLLERLNNITFTTVTATA